MRLEWTRCTGNLWCGLVELRLDLLDPATEGVYLIWLAGSRWLYAGQGVIADRLSEHRNPNSDSGRKILDYQRYGALLVSWASVLPAHKSGVENYLAKVCNPAVGHHYPTAPEIEVNLPGQ